MSGGALMPSPVACPAAQRALALAECRALIHQHGLLFVEVFPNEHDAVGLVDLDALKRAGLNSQAESERLLAEHLRRDHLNQAGGEG